MEEIAIVLIGHKDHGKSTLIGRLILDSGSINQDRLKKIKEADQSLGKKFELAHLVDSFREERKKEMTLDTTRVILKGKEKVYQLIDVPGHKKLISHMLTGASAAQAAFLVVAVNEGIKEQTLKHLEIAHILGIKQLGVIINKMDKVGYQKNSFEKIVEELKKILGEIGYPANNISFFPISALKGDNVIKPSSRISWYDGPTLMAFIEGKVKSLESFEDLPLRFLVQDNYPEGEEEIVVGKVESGRLKEGQTILFSPQKKIDTIKKIMDFESRIKEAIAGRNVGITLMKRSKVVRGMVGSLSESTPQVSNVLSGEVFWIKKPLSEKLVCECGTTQVKGKIIEPKIIRQGEKSYYKIFLKKEITIDPLSKTILSKIVLKDEGKIIGVGNIK